MPITLPHVKGSAEHSKIVDTQAPDPAPAPVLAGVLAEAIEVMVESQKEVVIAHQTCLARLEAVLKKLQKLA